MIPFSPPRIDDKIIDAVTEALKSGWITTGPRTKSLEKEISAYCGTSSSLCLNSWTNAVELFLRWWGVGPGDEVIVPAYTYAATANIVVHCGATPVLCDVDENALLDVNAAVRLISQRTKVIMPVDIGGLPFDYPALYQAVREYTAAFGFIPGSENQRKLGRILILADAAHSFGASLDGVKAGKMADVTGFSFHAVKNLTTAEGGALTFHLPDSFDSNEVYKELAIKGLHGQTKDALSKMQAGAWKYDIIEPGYKCNMTDIQAAIGLVELARYDEETIPRRKSISSLYSQLLAPYSWAILPKLQDDRMESSYHLYMLRIRNASEEQRDSIIKKVAEAGVSVNVHFMPLPLLTCYKNMGFAMQRYPGAYSYYANEISLPVYFDLSDDQVKTVVSELVNAVEEVML
jgi:dTDP-4-amino-4,6-dideoxygalactose transaminase